MTALKTIGVIVALLIVGALGAVLLPFLVLFFEGLCVAFAVSITLYCLFQAIKHGVFK
jgi:hypothetical protein